ncbi:MAG: hypothetical protein M0Q49_03605 [Porticoccaceae bacterium]|nr:hypothetical protein [Porticoccaceae bacterium]
MGCAPIIVIGMDCYTGATYFHNPAARSSGEWLPLDGHLDKWRRLIELAPDADVRAPGGPLAALFPPLGAAA